LACLPSPPQPVPALSGRPSRLRTHDTCASLDPFAVPGCPADTSCCSPSADLVCACFSLSSSFEFPSVPATLLFSFSRLLVFPYRRHKTTLFILLSSPYIPTVCCDPPDPPQHKIPHVSRPPLPPLLPPRSMGRFFLYSTIPQAYFLFFGASFTLIVPPLRTDS